MTTRKKASSVNAAKAQAVETPTERAIRDRIAEVMREFCERERCAPATVHERLEQKWPLQETIPGARNGETRVRAPSKSWAQKLCNADAKGGTIPNGDMLYALSARLGINAEWILTGTGPKRRGERVATADLAADFAAAVQIRCAAVLPRWGIVVYDVTGLLEFALRNAVETFTADQQAQQVASKLRGDVGSLAALGMEEPTTTTERARKRQQVERLKTAIGAEVGAVAPPRRLPIGPRFTADVEMYSSIRDT